MVSKTYDQLILGNAPETILAGSDKLTPTISESLFLAEVLPLLESPFGTEMLHRYSRYVGELTQPLKVLEDNHPENVLFTVPALVQSPVVTIATAGGMTAENFMQSLSREAELGGRNIHEKIHQYMMRMTKTPDYRKAVLEPIQAILARYGKKLITAQGPEETPDTVKASASETSSSSFSDDYED